MGAKFQLTSKQVCLCIHVVEGLNKFLKFFGSKFQLGDCSQLVLNF